MRDCPSPTGGCGRFYSENASSHRKANSTTWRAVKDGTNLSIWLDSWDTPKPSRPIHSQVSWLDTGEQKVVGTSDHPLPHQGFQPVEALYAHWPDVLHYLVFLQHGIQSHLMFAQSMCPTRFEVNVMCYEGEQNPTYRAYLQRFLALVRASEPALHGERMVLTTRTDCSPQRYGAYLQSRIEKAEMQGRLRHLR